MFNWLYKSKWTYLNQIGFENKNIIVLRKSKLIIYVWFKFGMKFWV